jgi:hypothetical protein
MRSTSLCDAITAKDGVWGFDLKRAARTEVRAAYHGGLGLIGVMLTGPGPRLCQVSSMLLFGR